MIFCNLAVSKQNLRPSEGQEHRIPNLRKDLAVISHFMRAFITQLIFVLGIAFSTAAQVQVTSDLYDTTDDYFPYRTLNYSLTTNKTWARNSETITFQNQGDYNSTYIAIDTDSSFTFLSIYEPGEHLTFGHWKKLNDSTYCLTWDQCMTYEICENRNVCRKYYDSSPSPFPIRNWTFVREGLKLMPLVNDYNK